ncbi:MAG TPA: TadE family protein, partial [Candidatus Dormibacteraeota bacterium]|nr:TadE family protein [Candidatus Dormibacteraeota bacterium]
MRPPLCSDAAQGARRGRRGQALTEFALLSPAFFLLIFGIVAGALMLNAQATLDNATREAARQAALCGGAMGAWTDGQGTAHTGGTSGSP